MIKKILSVAMIATVIFATSCSGNGSNEKQPTEKISTETNDGQQPQNQEQTIETQSVAPEAEQTPAQEEVQPIDLNKKFICPNRCESSETAGVCSSCGMDYIENLDYTE
mgnify:CR=1 FL=1